MIMAEALRLELTDTYLTLDSGFDSQENKTLITSYNLIPVIFSNVRNTQDPEKLDHLFDDFHDDIYKERYRIERCFAWQDVYRKLALSYDRLPEIRMGFRYLAYSMINFRTTFNKNS